MDKTDERTIAQGGSMRRVHIFETLWGDKISNVKGDACNPWRFSLSIDRVIVLGGHSKEGWFMEGPYPNPREVGAAWACWRPWLSFRRSQWNIKEWTKILALAVSANGTSTFTMMIKCGAKPLPLIGWLNYCSGVRTVMDMAIFRSIFFELLVFFTFMLLTLHFAY